MIALCENALEKGSMQSTTTTVAAALSNLGRATRVHMNNEHISYFEGGGGKSRIRRRRRSCRIKTCNDPGYFHTLFSFGGWKRVVSFVLAA